MSISAIINSHDSSIAAEPPAMAALAAASPRRAHQPGAASASVAVPQLLDPRPVDGGGDKAQQPCDSNVFCTGDSGGDGGSAAAPQSNVVPVGIRRAPQQPSCYVNAVVQAVASVLEDARGDVGVLVRGVRGDATATDLTAVAARQMMQPGEADSADLFLQQHVLVDTVLPADVLQRFSLTMRVLTCGGTGRVRTHEESRLVLPVTDTEPECDALEKRVEALSFLSSGGEQRTVTSLGEHLIMYVPLFSHHTGSAPRKRRCTTPLRIQFASATLELVAAVAYHGSAPVGGHYTAYTRRGSGAGAWFHVDDASVEAMPDAAAVEKALAGSAELLIYSRVRADDTAANDSAVALTQLCCTDDLLKMARLPGGTIFDPVAASYCTSRRAELANIILVDPVKTLRILQLGNDTEAASAVFKEALPPECEGAVSHARLIAFLGRDAADNCAAVLFRLATGGKASGTVTFGIEVHSNCAECMHSFGMDATRLFAPLIKREFPRAPRFRKPQFFGAADDEELREACPMLYALSVAVAGKAPASASDLVDRNELAGSCVGGWDSTPPPLAADPPGAVEPLAFEPLDDTNVAAQPTGTRVHQTSQQAGSAHTVHVSPFAAAPATSSIAHAGSLTDDDDSDDHTAQWSADLENAPPFASPAAAAPATPSIAHSGSLTGDDDSDALTAQWSADLENACKSVTDLRDQHSAARDALLLGLYSQHGRRDGCTGAVWRTTHKACVQMLLERLPRTWKLDLVSGGAFVDAAIRNTHCELRSDGTPDVTFMPSRQVAWLLQHLHEHPAELHHPRPEAVRLAAAVLRCVTPAASLAYELALRIARRKPAVIAASPPEFATDSRWAFVTVTCDGVDSEAAESVHGEIMRRAPPCARVSPLTYDGGQKRAFCEVGLPHGMRSYLAACLEGTPALNARIAVAQYTRVELSDKASFLGKWSKGSGAARVEITEVVARAARAVVVHASLGRGSNYATQVNIERVLKQELNLDAAHVAVAFESLRESADLLPGSKHLSTYHGLGAWIHLLGLAALRARAKADAAIPVAEIGATYVRHNPAGLDALWDRNRAELRLKNWEATNLAEPVDLDALMRTFAGSESPCDIQNSVFWPAIQECFEHRIMPPRPAKRVRARAAAQQSPQSRPRQPAAEEQRDTTHS